MVRPQAPRKRPDGMCKLRTTTCKFDGACPNGWEQYEKDVKRYRDIINDAKAADQQEAAFFVRRKEIAEKMKR